MIRRRKTSALAQLKTVLEATQYDLEAQRERNARQVRLLRASHREQGRLKTERSALCRALGVACHADVGPELVAAAEALVAGNIQREALARRLGLHPDIATHADIVLAITKLQSKLNDAELCLRAEMDEHQATKERARADARHGELAQLRTLETVAEDLVNRVFREPSGSTRPARSRVQVIGLLVRVGQEVDRLSKAAPHVAPPSADVSMPRTIQFSSQGNVAAAQAVGVARGSMPASAHVEFTAADGRLFRGTVEQVQLDPLDAQAPVGRTHTLEARSIHGISGKKIGTVRT